MIDLERCHDAFARATLAGLPRGGRVAVVGIGKNVGKTTALNTLLAFCRRQAVRCGVLSIGRDGEPVDVLSGLPKPPVRVGHQDVFATTPRRLAALGDAATEVLRFTWGARPDTVLAIARREIDVELVSPGTIDRVRTVAGEAARLTDGWVFVDGAFGRRSPASGRVADRVVLAVGAAVGDSPGDVVELARAYTEVYECGPPPGRVVAAARAYAGRTAVLASDTGELASSSSGLPSPAAGSRWYAFVPGAVTDRTLDSLRGTGQSVGLVVPEVSHLLVSGAAWSRWRQDGGDLYVMDPVPLAAVTVNPVCPGGWAFEARTFSAAIAAATRAPVFDLRAGICFP